MFNQVQDGKTRVLGLLDHCGTSTFIEWLLQDLILSFFGRVARPVRGETCSLCMFASNIGSVDEFV
jgi:hypothetical protein